MNSPDLPDDPRRWPGDPFELLGVARGAVEIEIKRAYTRLIRRFKPEHHPEEFRLSFKKWKRRPRPMLRSSSIRRRINRRRGRPSRRTPKPRNFGFPRHASMKPNGSGGWRWRGKPKPRIPACGFSSK
jgi:hypothetical protein